MGSCHFGACLCMADNAALVAADTLHGVGVSILSGHFSENDRAL